MSSRNRDASCVEVCPVNCIHEGDDQYHIDPDECIGCSACATVCPVNAIYDEDELREQWKGFIQKNADFFKALRLRGWAKEGCRMEPLEFKLRPGSGLPVPFFLVGLLGLAALLTSAGLDPLALDFLGVVAALGPTMALAVDRLLRPHVFARLLPAHAAVGLGGWLSLTIPAGRRDGRRGPAPCGRLA